MKGAESGLSYQGNCNEPIVLPNTSPSAKSNCETERHNDCGNNDHRSMHPKYVWALCFTCLEDLPKSINLVYERSHDHSTDRTIPS